MLIGCCLFAYIIGSIGRIITQIHNEDKELTENLHKLNNYLENKSVSMELRIGMRKFLY